LTLWRKFWIVWNRSSTGGGILCPNSIFRKKAGFTGMPGILKPDFAVRN